MGEIGKSYCNLLSRKADSANVEKVCYECAVYENGRYVKRTVDDFVITRDDQTRRLLNTATNCSFYPYLKKKLNLIGAAA